MSEEILKALVQLYAIITKQDGGVTEKEREFVIAAFKKKLSQNLVKKYVELYDELVGYNKKEPETAERKSALTSVKDSVKTLALCKKINKTLTYKQKVVALIELLELVRSDGNYTNQRTQIIDTVSVAFNITPDEHKSIEAFVLKSDVDGFDSDKLVVVNSHEEGYPGKKFRHLYSEYADGNLFFFRIESADMIFVKYVGYYSVNLNGFILEAGATVLFSHGSTVKLSKGDCYYYSDIHSLFINEFSKVTLSFNVKNLSFCFANKKIGLRSINLSEEAGKLVGIMGASGAGKTTLLNVLAGLEKPSDGEVLLNGVNVHQNLERVRGMMGYISQDDLLIEELTVFENLFFNAQLCFKGRQKEEIEAMVEKVLNDLGLLHIKNLQVGNPLNKKISGGQRKRLNIALELIREPSVLFVDEPTSGLSSRDSENVIDLLKELSRKGALIFVVIHQPSSDIYKIFDKMVILDSGGYLIFNGNPIEAITYFKRISHQVDAENGQCEKCGNVNPEQIFNIIEEKVVDEYGNYTATRKIASAEWGDYYKANNKTKVKEDLKDVPIKPLLSPKKFNQFLIYTIRDIKAKISNKQYLVVNFLEAPVLALILAIIVRYNNTLNGTSYLFRYNDNIPAYMLMSIVVALFIGLSLSADEIIKDRKINKRESFLNLSRLSYLCSKLFILFLFSAFQMLVFVLIGNSILEIKGMMLNYWLVLFTCACMADVLGLLVSSGFESAVTVYILIPLLLIPQMILSGAMLSFDKINDLFRSDDNVPMVADLMASRWAFEALSVKQYKDNNYDNQFYKYDQVEAISNFNLVYVVPVLKEKVKDIKENLSKKDAKSSARLSEDINLLVNEFSLRKKMLGIATTDSIKNLFKREDLNENIFAIELMIDQLKVDYEKIYNHSSDQKEALLFELEMQNDKNKSLAIIKDHYSNESLEDLVKNKTAATKYHVTKYEVVPKTDPIYFIPTGYNYRSHFFAPVKNFFGKFYDTYVFNLCFIWFLTLISFVLLYYDVFRKIMSINFKSLIYIFKNPK